MYHFKQLVAQPASGDSIELRVPGTATKITGQIKDKDGNNLSNPFLVSSAGGIGNWIFDPPDKTIFDIYWVEGDEVIGASQEGPVLGADDNYVTDAEKIVIGNTSGVNTGDQDLTVLLPRSAWWGTFAESFDARLTSDGTTITMSLEKTGSGDLTMQLSDGLTALSCSPACTIALTEGTNKIPQKNYVYIPQSTKALTLSTTGWPTTEHIKVGFFFVQSAAYIAGVNDGALINLNINNELASSNGMGHIAHIGDHLRRGRGWFSGCDGGGTDGYLTIGSGTCTVQVNAGVIMQLHEHIYTAKDTSGASDIHVINDSVSPYLDIHDLTNLTLDANGDSTNNKYLNIVLAGAANKTGEYSPLLLLLPSGSYNSASLAIEDPDATTNYALPREFTKDSPNGFLIARLTIRLSGGNITLHDTRDLRGETGSTASGGVGAVTTEFADSQFTVYDNLDVTKKVALDVSSITAGNTRTIVVPDKDGKMMLQEVPYAFTALGTLGATATLDMANLTEAYFTATLDTIDTTFTLANVPAGATGVVLDLTTSATVGNLTFTATTPAPTIEASKTYRLIWTPHPSGTGYWLQSAEAL